MKEVLNMWKYPYMIALTIICAAVYLIGLIPFKSIPLIPGFTEIRPASMFPVLFGLLFGPAGAWGTAIGNLIGDFFGTFSIGSVFGFIGNFFLAYLPYKLWGRLGIFSRSDNTPNINNPRKLIEFGFISIISCFACALIIAWGIDSLGLVPFASLASIIILNNSVMTLVFGPILLPFLYRIMKKRGLIWTDILVPSDISESKYPQFYSLLVAIGAIGGIAVGYIMSLLFAGQTIFSFTLPAGVTGRLPVEIGVLPFLLVLVFGASRL